MNEDTEETVDCAAVSDDLTELALGILTGRERSIALAHVESCEKCAAELEQLSMVVDNVMQLAPEAEPPVGFELRLSQRLQGIRVPRRPSKLRRLSVYGAAAAIAIVLGVGIGVVATNNNPAPVPTASHLTSATLTMNGQSLGQILVSDGAPTWLFMSIDNGKTSGIAWCDVTLSNGKVIDVGKFRLSDGYGAWAVPLSIPAGKIVSASVVGAHDVVLASAKLS